MQMPSVSVAKRRNEIDCAWRLMAGLAKPLYTALSLVPSEHPSRNHFT